VCHGFCGSAEGGSSLDLAASLQDWDLAVLRFRFTPQRCLSRQVSEIGAVVEFCRNQISRNVALLGRSMGAAAALAFAAQDRGISGLCLMASPADLPATFRGILRDDYTRLEQGQAVTVFHEGEPVHLTPEFIHDLYRYDLVAAVRILEGVPLFIVHGLDDETVPVEHGRILYAAAGEPKQLLLLPNHAHSFTGCAARFVPAVTQWLISEVFPPSPVI
jgi:putative redox protein